MSEIAELGHVGLYVSDLALMRSFYCDVIGLTVSDEDTDRNAVFLSSRPDIEHHELVLVAGRTSPRGTQLVQQLSWRVNSVASLQQVYGRLLKAGAPIVGVVSHGNAIGVYFEDPDGNNAEVYVQTGIPVPQPFRREISLDGDAESVLAESARLVEEAGIHVP